MHIYHDASRNTPARVNLCGCIFSVAFTAELFIMPSCKKFYTLPLDKAYSIKYPIRRTYIRVQQLNKLPRSTSDLHIRGCARSRGTIFCTAGCLPAGMCRFFYFLWYGKNSVDGYHTLSCAPMQREKSSQLIRRASTV